MRDLFRVSAIIVMLPLLFIGCEGILGGAGEQNLLDRLEQSREIWAGHEADTYNFTYVRGSLEQEGPQTEVFVVDNQIDSVAVNDQPGDVDEGLTVEDVFNLVEDAITADSDQFEMGFHNAFGYPEYYAVVYRRTDRADSDVFELLSFESDQLERNDNGNGNGTGG